MGIFYALHNIFYRPFFAFGPAVGYACQRFSGMRNIFRRSGNLQEPEFGLKYNRSTFFGPYFTENAGPAKKLALHSVRVIKLVAQAGGCVS